MKGKLLEAARSLFAEHGYDAVSVSDITSRAGVTAAALYVHYKNKRAIYDELLHAAGPDVILANIERVPLAANADPQAFLRSIVDATLEDWASCEARTAMTLFNREMLNSIDRAGAVFKSIDGVIQALTPYFASWQRAHLVDSTHPPDMLIWELFAPLVYIRFAYLQLSSSDDHIARGCERARQHLEYFLASTIGAGARSKPAQRKRKHN